MIPVCQSSFLDALLIKKDRVKGIMKRFDVSGGRHPTENRGGDRRSQMYEAKKNPVHWEFHQNQGQGSHYCRSKTHRLYLSSELNIKKMWRNNSEQENDLKVKQGFFRNVFRSEYNIGLWSPRTDVCSTCISLQEKIKSTPDLQTQKGINYR